MPVGSKQYQGSKAGRGGRRTSFFLLDMFFSMSFTALADSESRRLTLAPDDEESCITTTIKPELVLETTTTLCAAECMCKPCRDTVVCEIGGCSHI